MIVDGNEQEQQQQAPAPVAPAPVVDANEIVERLFSKFESERGREPSRQEKDHMAALYSELKRDGWDDQAINAHLLTANLVDAKISSKVEETAQKIVAQTAIQQARNYVRAGLRQYTKEEPRLAKVAELLESKVAAKFDASMDNKRQLWQGNVNTDALDTIMESVVDEFCKDVLGLDKAKNLGLNKSNAQAKTEVQKEQKSEAVSFDSLNEDQQEFYIARVESLVRRQGKTEEEAKKIAFEAARNLPAQPSRARR